VLPAQTVQLHWAAWRRGPARWVGLPIDLQARQDIGFQLKADVPKTAKSGDSYTVDVVQRDVRGQTLGGLRIKVAVK